MGKWGRMGKIGEKQEKWGKILKNRKTSEKMGEKTEEMGRLERNGGE